MKPNTTEDCTVLINVANSMEADLIISQLEANNIPSYKAYQSSGSYLNIAAGFNYQGTDIFVPKALLEQAKAIITEEQVGSFEDVNEEEASELVALGSAYRDKRKSMLRLIIVVITIPIVIALFYNLQEWF